MYGHCPPSNSFELASWVLWAIDSIHECMSSNRLSLNTGKTQFIWLGTKHSLAKRDTDRLFNLLPSMTELTSVRNLGLNIDQELHMKDHITKLCQSCYYQLRQLGNRLWILQHVWSSEFANMIRSQLQFGVTWLPVPFRIQYKFNSITRICLAGHAPEYLIELCHSVNDIPARRYLRSSSQVQLLVPRYRKERSGRRGFSVSSPQLWNSLPTVIRLLYNEN